MNCVPLPTLPTHTVTGKPQILTMSNKCQITKTCQVITSQQVIDHLSERATISLNDQLNFTNLASLKSYALVPPLVVLYHYAKAINIKLEVRDMLAGGHKSHDMGSELDFRPAEGSRIKAQLPVVADLLRLSEKLKSSLNSYRLGFYFARFDDATAIAAAKKGYTQFVETYTGNLDLLHLGVTYPWNHARAAALYAPISTTTAPFAFWGRDSEGFGKKRFWERKITKDFKSSSQRVGHLSDAKLNVLKQSVLETLRILDRWFTWEDVYPFLPWYEESELEEGF